MIVDFDFKDDIKDDKLVLSANPDPEVPLYDINRNLVTSSTSSGDVDRVCYVSEDRKTVMKILAYIVLLSYAFCLAVLLLMTLCCWSGYKDLGGLWKFLVHHWMKL